MRQKFRLVQLCKNALVFFVVFLCLSFTSVVHSQVNSIIQVTGSTSLSEGGSLPVIFQLNPTFPTDSITVGYTLSGDAQLGVDYSLFGSSVVIPAGQNSARLNIIMTDDAINEGDELIFITLTSHIGVPSGSTLTNNPINNELRVVLQDNFETQSIQMDYGDALDATANHSVVDGLRLGAIVDTEPPGTVNLSANRDDTNTGLANIARNATIITSTAISNISDLNNGRTDNGDVFSTANAGPNLEYIQLDLGSAQTLSSIVFHGSLGISNSVVMLSSSPFILGVDPMSFENNFDMADYRFTLNNASNLDGVIRLQLPTLSNIQYLLLQRVSGFGDLSLNEIQVYADNSIDDEDGLVEFSPVFLTADSYTMTSSVSNPTNINANLYGWIDFDGSGSFDSDEMTQVPVTANSTSNVPLNWTVPADIIAGNSVLRLRLTSDTLSVAEGVASNGEVEDHPLTINQEPVTANISVLNGTQESSTGSVRFLISLTRNVNFPLDSTLTVFYSIDGSATAVEDYVTPESFVVFTGLSTQATIVISTLDDEIAEGNESIRLTISTDNGAEQGINITSGISQADAIITDDDLLRIVQVTAEGTAMEQGGQSGQFVITVSGLLRDDLTINYNLSGGANSSDYDSLSGIAVIVGGSTSTTVFITPIDDAIAEPNETVLLSLAANSGVSPNISVLNGPLDNALLTIIENDQPILSVSPNGRPDELGTAANFDVSLNFALSTSLTAFYSVGGRATPGNNATAGDDYMPLSGQVVINAGSFTASIAVNPLIETIALQEGEEDIVVSLTTNQGAPSGITVTNSLTNSTARHGIIDNMLAVDDLVDAGDAPVAFGIATAIIVDGVRLGDDVDAELTIAQGINADNDDITAGIENVSINRPASNSTGGVTDPNRAVDGGVNRFSDPTSSLFITDTLPYEWWQVDLQSLVNVNSIIINHRINPLDRIEGVYLFLAQTPFPNNDNDVTSFNESFDHADYRLRIDSSLATTSAIAVNLTGLASNPNIPNTVRYVRLQRDGSNSNAINLTEVQVFAETLNTNDEDGPTPSLPALTVSATSYSVQLQVANPNGDSIANVYGWIDFNMNDTFEDNEVATAALPANNNTSVTLTWNGLTNLSLGNTYGRFRVTSDNLLDSDSTSRDSRASAQSSNGEVEDFLIPIVSSNIQFSLVSNGTPTEADTLNAQARQTGQFNIQLSGEINRAVTAEYTIRGSAINGLDYLAIPTTLFNTLGFYSTSINDYTY